MINLSKVSNKLKDNFFLFFQLYWDKISPDTLIVSKHIEFICNELELIGKGILEGKECEYDWVIINVPPGSSKSTICSIIFPCWILANDSSKFIINSSYSDTLATGFIRKSKAIIESGSFVDLFGEIELTKDNEGYIETKKGGGRFATSTGGTITGSHADLIIIDDPLSVEQSYSKAHIDRANRYLTETIPTRVRDKKKVPKILIMQRLNQDDPTGHIIASGQRVRHICLPSEITPSCTNEELYTDGLLDPQRMGYETLEQFKKFPYSYACQFLQTPAPLGGGLFKKEWFKISEYQNERKVIFIDGAYTNNKMNDPTGILITSFNGKRILIHNYIRVWYTLAELLREFPNIAEQNNISGRDEILVEPKASGKDVVSMFQAMFSVPTNEYTGNFIKSSKMERAQTSAPYCQSGNVDLIAGSWNDVFVQELQMFPNAKHDEAIDLLAYAIEHFLIQRDSFIINV